MATRKHPDDYKHDPKKAADKTAATTAPQADVKKPHDDKQAAKADKSRPGHRG